MISGRKLPTIRALKTIAFFRNFIQMLPDDTRNKIENITKGIILKGLQDNCATIRNILCSSFATSTSVKTDFEGKAIIKEEQAKFLEKYSIANNIWISEFPPEDRYLTRGGEALVYLALDNRNVIKYNDAVYYATWLEFFNSVLLHNLIFENIAYSLEGFAKRRNILYAF